MTIKDVFGELLSRYQHLNDYGDNKLVALIAFNSVLIFGLLAIYEDRSCFMKGYFVLLIILNAMSLFFAFSGVFAKRKNRHSKTQDFEEKNYYYYKYVATLTEDELIKNIETDYNIKSSNKQLEKDLANQIVVLAANSERKFRYFNVALNFTLASLITPIGLLVFHLYNNPNWQ